jgi:uncharacterized membrane protein YbhN (UPF0104 family)
VTDAPRSEFRRVHVVVGLFATLAVAVLVVVSVGRVAGFAKVTDTVREGDTQWLLVCVAGQIIVFGAYAAAFRAAVAFENGPIVARGTSVQLALAGFAATQVVAAGGVAGLGFNYWAMRRCGVERRDALVRLIGLNTAVFLMLGAIGFVSAAVALAVADVPIAMSAAWLAGVPLIVAAAAWFTDARRVDRATAATEGRVRRALAVGIAAAAWVRRALRARERTLFGSATLYWLGDMISLWGALHAFGGAPLAALPLAYATGYLAQSLPIPFIATGGADVATTWALHAVGVPLEHALVGVLAHRLFAFRLPVGPGVAVAAKLLRERDRASAPEPV